MRSVAEATVVGLMALSTTMLSTAAPAQPDNNIFQFPMVVSGGAASCLPRATGNVSIIPTGPVEQMTVAVSGLPPKTDFDFFVIQVPKAPFGMSWYQGDIETDANGNGHGLFRPFQYRDLCRRTRRCTGPHSI